MWIPGCYYGTNYQSQGIDEWHTPFHPCVLLSDLLSTGGPLSINSNLNYALYSLTCLERVATSISQLKMLIFCIPRLCCIYYSCCVWDVTFLVTILCEEQCLVRMFPMHTTKSLWKGLTRTILKACNLLLKYKIF